MQLQDIILQPLAIHTQGVVNENIQEGIKKNERDSQEAYVRYQTTRLAYTILLNAIPL
jgi:hypothetical protein